MMTRLTEMSIRYAKSNRLGPKVPALMDEAFTSLQELFGESPERFCLSAFGYAEHDEHVYRYVLSITISPGEDFSDRPGVGRRSPSSRGLFGWFGKRNREHFQDDLCDLVQPFK